MYKKMYLMLAISFAAFGQEGYQKYLNLQRIKSSSIVAPLALGKLSLYYGPGAFKIKLNKKFYDVEHCWVDPMLRGIDTQRLGAFLRAGYISINKLNSGEYTLRGHIKGHGGGPLTGQFVYWLTKTSAYSLLVGAAGTAIVMTGGGVVAATGVGMANAAAGLGLAATIPAAGGAAATIGGAGVTAAAVALGAEGTLVVATGTTVASTGGLALTATTIEVVATGLGAAATAIPWLP